MTPENLLLTGCALFGAVVVFNVARDYWRGKK